MAFGFGYRSWVRRLLAAVADVSSPTRIGSPVIAADGRSIAITYNETLAEVPSHLVVFLNGTPVLSSSSSGVGTTVWTIGLDSAILANETVTITTVAGPKDAANNEAATMTTVACTNNSNMALEVAAATFFGSTWSLTDYAPHRALEAELWGGGGGGDGGTGAGGSGAGSMISVLIITDTKAGGYTGVNGVGGSAGTGSVSGTATAGTDTTMSDVDGVVTRSKGQPPGVGGAVTGTGGVSTTSGSLGTTVWLGGNGTGTSGVNIGGASAGRDSAASTSTPGAPDGVRGLGSAAAPHSNGGGTTAGPNATGFAGGNGYTVVFYQRAVARVRPICIGIRNDRRITNATSTVMVLADGSRAVDVRAPASGDVCVAMLAIDGGTGTSPAATGWRKVGTDVGTVTVPMLFSRNWTGGDPVTVTHASEISNWFTYIFEDCSDESDITATSASIAANNPDPGSHDHGAVVDGLWFVMLAGDQGSTTPLRIDTFPASTDNQLRTTFSLASGAVNLAVGFRELLATQVADFSPWGTSGQAANGGIIVGCIPKA
jgi:hypothetical protein